MARLYYNSCTKQQVKPWDLARGWKSCGKRKSPTRATRDEAWIFPSRVAPILLLYRPFGFTRHTDPAQEASGRPRSVSLPAGRGGPERGRVPAAGPGRHLSAGRPGRTRLCGEADAAVREGLLQVHKLVPAKTRLKPSLPDP